MSQRIFKYRQEEKTMHELLAKSDRQLGMCLRMLYDEGMPKLDVHSEINDKGKMEFHVLLPVDDETFERLQKRFETMVR